LQSQQLSDLIAVTVRQRTRNGAFRGGTRDRRRAGPRAAPTLPHPGAGYQAGTARMFSN